MPDRIIREQARRSPTLRELTDAAERAWWRLTTACDDYGRFEADPEVLLARLFERRPDGWGVSKMTRVAIEWKTVGLVHLYGNATQEHIYGHIPRWFDHQRRRDSKPKFPDPPCGDSPQDAAKCGDSPLARARSESRESLTTESREPRAGMLAASGGERWPSPSALVTLYNSETPDECPAVTTLSMARKRKAQEYLAAFPAEAWWREVFAQVHRSRFLRGKGKPRDGSKRQFLADFDWLLTKGKDGTENAVKVHDGRYQDG